MAGRGFEENAGTNRLANVLSKRMKKEGESPLVFDFGEIQPNGSLVTNTFPVPIPKGDYSVCRHIGGLSYAIAGDGHSHTAEPPAVRLGDRVLVGWVQNEAVVIDVITGS